MILGVYRHHIRNIRDWLDALVATISNPTVELRRRGTEPSGAVFLTVPLDMTRTLEMARLDLLVRTLQPPAEGRVLAPIRPQQVQDDGPGVLDTIGAPDFGLGRFPALFGRKHG